MTEQEYSVLKQRLMVEVSSLADRILRPAFGLVVIETDKDRIKRFISECCNVAPNLKVKTADLYNGYNRWTLSNGFQTLTHKSFSSTLKNMYYNGITENDSGTWIGVELI